MDDEQVNQNVNQKINIVDQLYGKLNQENILSTNISTFDFQN